SILIFPFAHFFRLFGNSTHRHRVVSLPSSLPQYVRFCTSSDLHIFGNWIIIAGTYPPAPGKCELPGKWCYYHWSSRVCHPAQGEKTLGHCPFPGGASGAAPRHWGILWAQLLFRDGTWRGTSPPDLVTDRFMHMREIITQYVVFHHTAARDQSMTELVPP